MYFPSILKIHNNVWWDINQNWNDCLVKIKIDKKCCESWRPNYAVQLHNQKNKKLLCELQKLAFIMYIMCSILSKTLFFISEILLDSVLCYPSLWLKGLLTLSFFLALTTAMHFLLGFLKPHLINCNVCKTQLLGSWPVPGKMSILHQF